MKKSIFSALLMLPLIANADPAPFGLQLGNATIADVKSKYRVSHTGVNKYSKGDMYSIDVSTIDFEGLKSVTLIFGQSGKLLAVLTTLPNTRFDPLLSSLSGKYQLVSKQVPFVGNKSAKLLDGQTEIILEAPHMSFDMELNYINKQLYSAYQAQSAAEKQQKQKSEASQL